jgi:hypothetical protein
MKLGEQQELFMRQLPRLIDSAHELGYEIRGGSLFRDPRLHGQHGFPSIMAWLEQNYPDVAAAAESAGYRDYGSRTSRHKAKCAIDLNLRERDGGMVTTTDGHAVLGAWWENQHPMCRWGGRYNDGNHYEILEWR